MKFNRVLVVMFLLMISVFTINAAVPLNNNVAYWSLNQTLNDATGITGAISVDGAASTSNGFNDYGYDFDGAGDSLFFNDFNIVTNKGAIALWAKSDVTQAAGDFDLLFRWADNGNTGDIYCYFSYNLINEMACSAENTVGGSAAFFTYTQDLGTSWHHYVLNFNATALELFVDGVSVASDYSLSVSIETNNGMNLVWADRNFGGAEAFNGIQDEYAVFNNSLLASQVADLYNSDMGKFYPFIGPTTSVVTTIKPLYNTSTIGVQVNSSTIINLSYSLDLAAEVSVWTNQNNGSLNISGLSEGDHSIVWVGATNNLSQNFTIDLTAPSLNVTPFTTSNNYAFDFTSVINVSNVSSCIVAVESTTTTCTDTSYQFATNGNHSFNVTAIEVSGNRNVSLNNVVFVNPLQNFSFINSTGGDLSNYTFGGITYTGSQTQLLTFGSQLVFGSNTLTFEKLGFQTTDITFEINTTSHLNLISTINDSQINLRFFDRETLALITGITTITLVGPSGVNGTTTTGLFNISNINFDSGDYQVIGSNPTYFTESVFFTFTGQEVLQKDLYLISNSSTDAGVVTIQLTANTGQFIQGAICSALEWRPSQSAFVSVAEGNTNSEGATILNIEVGTKLYKFQCTKDGLSVTSPQQILQTTGSLIPLVLNVDAPAPVLLLENFMFSLTNITLNATHQQVIYNFSSVDGLVSTACLIEYKKNGNFRVKLAESCVSSSNGQIQLIVNTNTTFDVSLVATAKQSGLDQEVGTIIFLGTNSVESVLSKYGFDIFLPLFVVIVGITIGFMMVPANMAITSIITLMGMWFLRYIVPGIMSTSSTIFMSVVLLLIMWGSKR